MMMINNNGKSNKNNSFLPTLYEKKIQLNN